MALVTPIAQPHIAYDANYASMFYFTSTGGDQVVANRLTIRRNSDNLIIYQNKVTSYLLQQEAPASTLTNGIQYNYYFNTYNSSDDISENSNVQSFYCYTTPTIEVTNIPISGIVETAQYAFDVTYNQIEGEKIEYLQAHLYDSSNNLLESSSRYYSTDSPPINTSFTFSSLENNDTYKIKATAITIDGTYAESLLYSFQIGYTMPNLFSRIILENKCSDGYNKIDSNIALIEGIPYPEPAQFESHILNDDTPYIQWGEWYTPVDNKISVWTQRHALNLYGTDPLYYSEYPTGFVEWGVPYVISGGIISEWKQSNSILYQTMDKTLTFSSGFNVSSNFQYQSWQSHSIDGIIAELYKESNSDNKMIISLKSGVPSGETTIKVWLEAYTIDGDLLEYSNYVDAMRIDTEFIVWFKKIDDVYYMLLDVVNVGTGLYVEWNGTDIYPVSAIRRDISDLFPIDTVVLRNGLYENLDITSNTDRVYSRDYPIWDFYTELNCDFTDLDGGNINILLSQLESIKLKRRIDGTFNWLTLKLYNVTDIASLNISYNDNLAASGVKYDYALVPTLNGGIEGSYIIDSLDTTFRYCYLCDKDQIFVFIGGTVNGATTGNVNAGMLLPIGSRYPITIYNSENNYETGSFTGDVLGINFLDTRRMDKNEIITQLRICKDFINNKKQKIFKDFYGNIRVVSTSVNSGLQETINLQTGLATVSFNWTEVGGYNDQEDLYYSGLIDTLG